MPGTIRTQLPQVHRSLDELELVQTQGKIHSSRGLLLSCSLPAALGDCCQILRPGRDPLQGEVIGFSGSQTFLVLYEEGEIHPAMKVAKLAHGDKVPVGRGLLGRVIDGLGRPIDRGGPLVDCQASAVDRRVPAPMDRRPIAEIFVTGQRTLDGLFTFGKGQRVGIFAGSGVGKSTLLGEIAKHAVADVNVIALVGERGREVRPFIEDCLGPAGLAKSVVVVATSDQSPLLRVRSVQVALTIADFFRKDGLHVLFLCDSLTRLALAQRELGLVLGEPPSARSYTPSVFQMLANMVERLGNDGQGSITGLLTVLVEGGDMDEPIADAVRSLVDGHIVLDRQLAELGHYPAINIGKSISRLASDLMDPQHRAASRKVLAAWATYVEAEDLIRIGAYVKGTSPQLDRAVELRPAIAKFLQQAVNEHTDLNQTKAQLLQLAKVWPY